MFHLDSYNVPKPDDKSADDLSVNAFVYKPIIKADLAETVCTVLDAANAKNL